MMGWPHSRRPAAATLPGDRRRGAVLLMVLVLGLFGAALTVVALRAGSSAARAARVWMDEIQAEMLGQAATDLIAARLADPDKEARRAGSFRARFGTGTVTVAYVGESGRVDLNLASVELLTALFLALGAEPSVARSIADRILDWRDEDDEKRPSGAEREDYARSGRPGPANRPFTHVTELDQVLAVLDLDPTIKTRVRDLVTVAGGTEKVDPGLAPPLLIRALMGGDPGRADTYLAERAAGFASRREALAAFPSASRNFVGFEAGEAVRGLVTVTLDDGFTRRYETVVSVTQDGDRGQRAHVHAWRSLR